MKTKDKVSVGRLYNFANLVNTTDDASTFYSFTPPPPPPPPPPPDLTVLILCRNEGKSIVCCIKDALGFLERNAITGEVVVVDNNSQDHSAARASDAGARVVQEPREGYGNAINAGIAAARGRFIILGDGDGEHDLSALEPFWEKLQGGYDFVFGNRFTGEIETGAMLFLRRYVGNPLLSSVGKLFLRTQVGDFHCGLRGFRAASVRSLTLQCPGMEASSEMVIKAVQRNMRITEVPVKHRRAIDPDRSSHLQTFRDGWRHLRLLLMLSPRWLFLYPGCFLLAAGALVMSLPILDSGAMGGTFGVYTMLFGAAFVICGAQLSGFHLLANIFCEVIGLAESRLQSRVQRYNLLESGLVFGFVLALSGVAGCVWSLSIWAQTGPVEIESRLSIAIPSVTLLILGVQVMFFGFLMTLLATQKYKPRDAL